MNVDMQNIMLALELTIKGMAAIFVVIIAIYICVLIMLKLTKNNSEKDKKT